MRSFGVVVTVLSVLACGTEKVPDEAPKPPPARGAFTFSVRPPSPRPSDSSCPVAALTTDIPSGNGATENDYVAHVVDGEEGAVVRCNVAGTSTFSFFARIQQGGRGFFADSGVINADKLGSATITLNDLEHFPSPLGSSSCTIDARQQAPNTFQIKNGSMWASFTCPYVEAPPDTSCTASGYFVVENCDTR